MKKQILTSILGIVLSGFLIFSAVSYCNHQTELKRNREYEISLAKALKNSYKDIKEIQFSDPSYSEKPGGQDVKVQLTFRDGVRLMYRTGHHLGDTINHDGSFSGVDSDKNTDSLLARIGVTQNEVKVTHSTLEEEILQ